MQIRKCLKEYDDIISQYIRRVGLAEAGIASPVSGALKETKELIVPIHDLGEIRVRVEANLSWNGDVGSQPKCMISFLDPASGEPAPGVMRMFYFSQQRLSLQLTSSSSGPTSVDGMTDWIITKVIERHNEFLSCDHSQLNEFVSLSQKDRPALFKSVDRASLAILAAARDACMRIHLVGMSILYAGGIGGASLSPEDVADLWSRHIVADVMES